MIKKGWQEQKEIKNVMLFLQGNGVSTAYAVKIYKTYGNESINIVKSNPYRLADDIWGIGFRTADKIARQLGFDVNSFERCRSGILYVLNELSNDGHCYATTEQLLEETVKILELDRELIRSTLEKMKEEKSIIADMEDALYLPPFYFSETGTAKRIREILAACDVTGLLPQGNGIQLNIFNTGAQQCIEIQSSKLRDSAPQGHTGMIRGNDQAGGRVQGYSACHEEIIRAIQKEAGIEYDDVQVEAIRAALGSKFMVLTGGPGTGKTTTTLAIIKAFRELGRTVLLAAPTGRAAKRLSETTGMEAKTIHRLLEYKPPEGYKKNADNQLECDVLIIDETSMVDIILMYNLLKAVRDDTVVILVGDVDQLPSVGAGNVLRDVIDSGMVRVVRLTRIFRQAQGSAIIMNAHRINGGEFPALKGGKGSDFFFIEEEEPAKVVETIKDLCTRRLTEYYKVDPIQDIQILCPMQRGETGAYNLNIVLQDCLNPSRESVKYGGTEFRLNDKVMQIKNNYDKNVFNGDVGTIRQIDQEDRSLLISFDGIDVEYDVTELDEVVLAYATTVHKSQGSEYKIVIAPFTMQHYMMLQRNLLYTCVTRAKKVMVLVGAKKAIGMAVSNNRTQKRNTWLAQRLAGS
jgi:exodeoxyribonuclease V alpha subunit